MVATQGWLLLFLAGWAVVALGAWALEVSGNRACSIVVGFGMALALFGFLRLFRPRLLLSEVGIDRGRVCVLGVVSGLVAGALALLVEGPVAHALGESYALELWLAGPVEETSKLLVPLLLWRFGPRWCRDPRTGVWLVLLSGAAFGAVEGIRYVGVDGENAHLVMAAIRPPVELLHPLWTATAAAAIWLAAHRRRRLRTGAGITGWAVAVALHSFHDGLSALGRHGSTAPEFDFAASTVMRVVIASNVMSLLWIVASFLIARRFLRELVPPDAIASNPPGWLPRLRGRGAHADRLGSPG